MAYQFGEIMKIITFADIPLTGKSTGEIKAGSEEPLRSLDNNIREQVDRGYRAFWRRRGMQPPKVSSSCIESVHQPSE